MASSAIPLFIPKQRKRVKTEAEEEEEEEEEAEEEAEAFPLGMSEVRYGAMTVIGLLPLFNWLTWIFAYLDTQETRYLLYGVVYAAPYLHTGLSLSPDDSWLPLASVLLCEVHVQLEKIVEESDPIIADVPSWVKNFSLPKLPTRLPLPKGPDEDKKRNDEDCDDIRRSKEEAQMQMRLWDEKLRARKKTKRKVEENQE